MIIILKYNIDEYRFQFVTVLATLDWLQYMWRWFQFRIGNSGLSDIKLKG